LILNLQLQKKTENLESDKKELEKRIKESSAMEEELERLESENKELGKKSREHSRRVEALETDNQLLIIRQKKLQNSEAEEMSGLSDKVSTLESEKRELEKKVNQLSKRIEELESENQNLNQQMEKNAQRSADKMDKLKAKISRLNETIKQQEDKLEEARKAAKLGAKQEEKVQKLIEVASIEKALATAERRSSTTIDVQKDNARFNEALLAEPGAEKARYYPMEISVDIKISN
jgi:chromosome segregation ATPase